MMKNKRRAERLRKPADFKKVFRGGKRFSSPHFALYMYKDALDKACLPDRQAGRQARIGISISKRHFKLATRRNRLRRIAKEWFKRELSPSFKGYDFVVASRRAFPGSNINEAVREMKQLITNPR